MQDVDWVFQHDNNPEHTSKSTTQFIKDCGIKVLSWPAQSPDMNPIEHLWNGLDRRIRNRSELPTSASGLWEILLDGWEAIPKEFCQKLIKSMLERIKDLKKAKESCTKW